MSYLILTRSHGNKPWGIQWMFCWPWYILCFIFFLLLFCCRLAFLLRHFRNCEWTTSCSEVQVNSWPHWQFLIHRPGIPVKTKQCMNFLLKFLTKWRMLFFNPFLLTEIWYHSSTLGNFITSVLYMAHRLLIHFNSPSESYLERNILYADVDQICEAALLQKLTAALLLKKFLPFMKNWTFARLCHQSKSWAT